MEVLNPYVFILCQLLFNVKVRDFDNTLELTSQQVIGCKLIQLQVCTRDVEPHILLPWSWNHILKIVAPYSLVQG